MNQREFDAPLGDHRLGRIRCRIPNSHGSSLRQLGFTVQNHDAIVYSTKDFHAGILSGFADRSKSGLDRLQSLLLVRPSICGQSENVFAVSQRALF